MSVKMTRIIIMRKGNLRENWLQTKGIDNQVTNQQHCVSECYPLLKIKTHTKCNECQDDNNYYYYEKKQPQRELATD